MNENPIDRQINFYSNNQPKCERKSSIPTNKTVSLLVVGILATGGCVMASLTGNWTAAIWALNTMVFAFGAYFKKLY